MDIAPKAANTPVSSARIIPILTTPAVALGINADIPDKAYINATISPTLLNALAILDALYWPNALAIAEKKSPINPIATSTKSGTCSLKDCKIPITKLNKLSTICGEYVANVSNTPVIIVIIANAISCAELLSVLTKATNPSAIFSPIAGKS